MIIALRALVLSALLTSPLISAQPELGGETAVAERGAVTLTLGEVDAKIRSMPPELRSGYLGEPDRMARLIDTMLVTKQIAAEARKAGLNEGAEFLSDLNLITTELLSQRQLRQATESARIPDFEVLAKERYLADPESFRPEPVIELRHVLISTDGRADEEAQRAAQGIYDRTKAGENFLAVIEDVAKVEGDGLITSVLNRPDASRLDNRFVAAMQTLKNVGDLAGPVRTKFGYHVIRLDRFDVQPIPPFDEVKGGVVKQMQETYLADERTRYISSFSKQDITLNDEVVKRLPARYAERWGSAEVDIAPKKDAAGS